MLVRNPIRVLLVNPLYPEESSFWLFRRAVRMMGLKATMWPLNLATVAAMIAEWFPGQFEFLPIADVNVKPLTDREIEEADLVMFTAMNVQAGSLRDLLLQVKKFEKTKVVGGPYATEHPEEVLAIGADHLVLGEAELTLFPFLADFLAGKARSVYQEHSVVTMPGLRLTKEGKPYLDRTPVPRLDLIPDLFAYSSLVIETSRGCPFNCEFCDIVSLFGHETRVKSTEQVLAELDAIRVTGWKGSIFISDPNFIGHPKRALELLKALIAWQKKHRRPFSFFTEVSLNLADDSELMREIRRLMVLAGFEDIFVGIETTNLAALEQASKSQNLRGGLSLEEKVRSLQRDFKVMAGFIFGFDGDPKSIFDDMFRFIQSTGIVAAMVGMLTVLRGTKLYQRLAAEGRLKEGVPASNTLALEFNFQTKAELDEESLVEGGVNFWEKLFSPRYYYERCRIPRRLRGRPPRSARVNGNWLRATLIVFFLNLFWRPNWHFVKFMLETVFFWPRSLGEAVTYAVKFEDLRHQAEWAVATYRAKKQGSVC